MTFNGSIIGPGDLTLNGQGPVVLAVANTYTGPTTGPTTTTLVRTNGSEPSSGGVAVTFTATVSGTAPQGSVSFYDGLTLIGSSALDGSLQASFTTTLLSGPARPAPLRWWNTAATSPAGRP